MKILKGSLKEKEVTGREIKYNDAGWPGCSIRDHENKYFKVPAKDCEIVSEEHKNTILKSAGWGTFVLVAGGLKAAPVAICAAATGVFKVIRSKVVSAVLTLEDDTMLLIEGSDKDINTTIRWSVLDELYFYQYVPSKKISSFSPY